MASSGRECAVILGSGMGGLSTAKAVAEHYKQVIVIERDKKPETVDPRKGVPQGRHAHVLLRAGEDALLSLFPNITEEVVRRGGKRIDFGKDFAWFHHGIWRNRKHSNFHIHMQSRPLLEQVIRERLASCGNVDIRYESTVKGLDFENDQVVAVSLQPKGGDVEKLAVDLVVDATGRGSQLPKWLKANGLTEPPEDRVGIDLGYSSRVYQMPKEKQDFGALLVYQDPPQETRSGLIFPMGGDQWVVTLVGHAGDHPPKDAEGFVEYANSLPNPMLADAIRDAKPLTDARIHLIPYSRWRHYEKCSDLPLNLIALGDSVCSFDPAFGQGMSMAARGAVLLGEQLQQNKLNSRTFHSKLRFMNLTPWVLATTEDFRYPQTTGYRPPGLGLVQAYVKHVHKLCENDATIYERFFRVVHLIEGLHTLFYPRVLLPVLKRWLFGPKKRKVQEKVEAEDKRIAA